MNRENLLLGALREGAHFGIVWVYFCSWLVECPKGSFYLNNFFWGVIKAIEICFRKMWELHENTNYELPLGCSIAGTLHYINSFDCHKPYEEGTVVSSRQGKWATERFCRACPVAQRISPHNLPAPETTSGVVQSFSTWICVTPLKEILLYVITTTSALLKN